jgi:transmembrane sensor
MSNVVNFSDKSTIEEEASLWIAVFEGDDRPTGKDIEELNQWMSRSPLHRETLIHFANLWSDIDVLEELSVPTVHQAQLRGASRFRSNGADYISGFIQQLTARKVAASFAFICFVCVISISLLKPHFGFGELSNGLYTTEIGMQKKLDLPDGSTIWLNTGSEVEVDYSEQKRRLVLHRGEAFFDVAKNPSRPFEVYSGGNMVRAVGTAFSVYRERDNVKVTVTEGLVDLSSVEKNIEDVGQDGTPSMVNNRVDSASQPISKKATTTKIGSLSAGQSVELQQGETQAVINHSYQDIARSLSWRDGLLVFAGEPLNEVVKEISRYTSLKITLADPEIGSMRIGGQFKTGHTEALFDVLQAGFGLEVTYLSDNQVAISSGNKIKPI